MKTLNSSQKQLFEINNLSWKKKPLLKKNLKRLKNSAGRNNSGKISVRRKGKGHKKSYREIEFCGKTLSTSITVTVEYDPNRNANIAAIYNLFTQSFFYVLAPKNLKIGDVIKSSHTTEPKLGHYLPLYNIPIGSYIYNISTKLSKPGEISRSAGTFSKIKEKNLNHATIELSSGETKKISSQCYATIGIVSNELAFLSQLQKAGQSRWLNKRPKVRGVAMNPVDHPHGGGEGKKSGQNKTPWGKSNFKKTKK